MIGVKWFLKFSEFLTFNIENIKSNISENKQNFSN